MNSYVIDQNALRANPGRLRTAAERARLLGGHLLITDAGLAEMTKNVTCWESTSARSLASLRDHADVVGITRHVDELRWDELQSGVPTTSIVDVDVSLNFRSFLRELTGTGGPEVEKARKLIPAAQRKVGPCYFDHDENRSTVLAYVMSWRKALTGDELKTLRTDFCIGAPTLLARDGYSDSLLEKLVQKGPFSRDRVASLLAAHSMLAAIWISAAALALDWVAKGGIESAKPEVGTNDLVDLHNIRLALFAGGLITDDKRALRVYEASHATLERRAASTIAAGA